ncbi:MAG: sulfite exporter TauE/SafE family protein [Sedimentisphaerales bacterium]|nr:sulfite exporter TauE/SafE family protein [Sedimentisphaerales bacterium]
MLEIMVAVGAMFLAGIVQGCAGFGMALVAAPMLMLVLAPAAVVPMIVPLSTINSFVVAFEARRHIRPGLVAPLAAGGILGVPLGVHALKVLDPIHLKVGVGLFVVTVGVLLLKGWRMPLGDGVKTKLPVGIISGFFGGSTSMGGPPVVFFLANNDTAKDTFRANLVCYFFVVNCIAIATFFARHLITWQVAGRMAMCLPGMLLGTFLGVQLSRRVPEARFRKGVMILVCVTGGVLLLTNVRALF